MNIYAAIAVLKQMILNGNYLEGTETLKAIHEVVNATGANVTNVILFESFLLIVKSNLVLQHLSCVPNKKYKW